MGAYVRLNPGVPGSGVSAEWLDLIHECNRLTDGAMFGEPLASGDWWAGGFHETYLDARLILPGKGRAQEEGAILTSETAHGEEIIRQACANLGIVVAS
jgi:hypothetical protein